MRSGPALCSCAGGVGSSGAASGLDLTATLGYSCLQDLTDTAMLYAHDKIGGES